MGEAWNEKLRESGGEFGAATGRPRRVGPFDAVASRYGIRCQKAQDIALTKLDVLGAFDKIPVITGYRCTVCCWILSRRTADSRRQSR